MVRFSNSSIVIIQNGNKLHTKAHVDTKLNDANKSSDERAVSLLQCFASASLELHDGLCRLTSITDKIELITEQKNGRTFKIPV
jgi:hypothetical protein